MERREVRNGKKRNVQKLMEYVQECLLEATKNKVIFSTSIQVDRPQPMYMLGSPKPWYAPGPNEVLIRFKYVGVDDAK